MLREWVSPVQPEFVELFGKQFYNPTINGICTQVAWATMYADPRKLDETHPVWPDYFAYSEWFRHRICAQFHLPFDTKWEEIYRQFGVLVDEEYSSKTEMEKAHQIGENYLNDEMAPIMFQEFERIKFQITNRL